MVTKIAPEQRSSLTERIEMTEIALEKALAEIHNLNAETRKMFAETRKLKIEASWYPVVLSTAFVGVVIGIVKLFL